MIKYPTPSEQVQKGIDLFIQRKEAQKSKDDFLDYVYAKEAVFRARDGGRITQEDFQKALCKLATSRFRFMRDNPESIVYVGDSNG